MAIKYQQTNLSRDNTDTSVDAIPEYIRNTLLETSTQQIDLELKPFYKIPPRTYGGPSSYEASIFYEPPEDDYDAELYEFDSSPSSAGKTF